MPYTRNDTQVSLCIQPSVHGCAACCHTPSPHPYSAGRCCCPPAACCRQRPSSSWQRLSGAGWMSHQMLPSTHHRAPCSTRSRASSQPSRVRPAAGRWAAGCAAAARPCCTNTSCGLAAHLVTLLLAVCMHSFMTASVALEYVSGVCGSLHVPAVEWCVHLLCVPLLPLVSICAGWCCCGTLRVDCLSSCPVS
jgi:hypothetical protein